MSRHRCSYDPISPYRTKRTIFCVPLVFHGRYCSQYELKSDRLLAGKVRLAEGLRMPFFGGLLTADQHRDLAVGQDLLSFAAQYHAG